MYRAANIDQIRLFGFHFSTFKLEITNLQSLKVKMVTTAGCGDNDTITQANPGLTRGELRIETDRVGTARGRSATPSSVTVSSPHKLITRSQKKSEEDSEATQVSRQCGTRVPPNPLTRN